MKSQLDLSNKRHVGILLMPVWFVLLGIQIMQFEAGQRTIGLIAFGIVIISAIVLFIVRFRINETLHSGRGNLEEMPKQKPPTACQVFREC